MRKTKLLLLTTLFHISFFILYTSSAFAEEISLSTDPAVLRIESKRGVTIDAPITLENHSSLPVVLSIAYRSFTAAESNDGTLRFVASDDEERKLLAGTSIWEDNTPVPSINLAAKQKKTVKLHIVIQPDTPERDYYFSTLFSTSSSSVPENFPDTNNTYLQVQGTLATNVLLSVGGYQKPNISIAEFSAPSFVQHGPVPFTLRVGNNGKRLIRPTGTVRITNMFGQLVGKIKLDERNILAGSSRFLSASNFSTRNTQGDIVPALQWNEAILLGPYTVEVELTSSNSNEKVAKTIYFFALPYNRLGAVFLAGIVITAIILQVRRRMNH